MNNYHGGDLVQWRGSLWEVVEDSSQNILLMQPNDSGGSNYRAVSVSDLSPTTPPMIYTAATVKAAQAAADAHNAYMGYVETLGNAVLEGTLTPEQEAKLEAMNEACNRAQGYLMVCATVDLNIELQGSSK